MKTQNAIQLPGSMTRATYSVRTFCPSCKSRLPLERIAYTPSFPCPRCEIAIRVSPIFLYSPVAISIVPGILVPFLLGARDFNWLASSFAVMIGLVFLLAGLQPYFAKYLLAPRLTWWDELTSLGLNPELRRKAERAAARAKWNAERAIRIASLKAAEAPILLDLANIGIRVDSVWDLVSVTASHEEAIPLLLEHRGRPYPDEILRGIRMALYVNISMPSGYHIYGGSIRTRLERAREP